MGTFVIAGILVLAVALIIVKLVRDRKKGKSCSCGCEGCPSEKDCCKPGAKPSKGR